LYRVVALCDIGVGEDSPPEPEEKRVEDDAGGGDDDVVGFGLSGDDGLPSVNGAEDMQGYNIVPPSVELCG
jgi:hypothetical protein